MKTYISKLIDGFYCTDYVDEQYWEGQIGSTLKDFYDGKWVLLSDGQAEFHEQHPEATIEQVWDMNIPDTKIEDAKQEKLYEIELYDSSYSVNSFNVVFGENTISAWLTPAERSNYRSSIDAAELVGLQQLSLYIGDIPVTLPTETAKLMLALIQLYADQCFIVTKQHKNAIGALDSVESITNYDYTTGYPEKLTFTL